MTEKVKEFGWRKRLRAWKKERKRNLAEPQSLKMRNREYDSQEG